MILPSSVERVVPSWFAAALSNIDPNLICYFNPLRRRWVIDRCTRGGELNAAAHSHNAECPRVNVTVVQDEGKYMPLCDAVLTDLRSKDTWAQHGTAENYHRFVENQHAEGTAKTDKAVRNLYTEASADNRRQLNEAWTIQQTHDLARPHTR